MWNSIECRVFLINRLFNKVKRPAMRARERPWASEGISPLDGARATGVNLPSECSGRGSGGGLARIYMRISWSLSRGRRTGRQINGA
jgi:hypothetical protein